MERVKAPGLKWRKLASGLSPVWVADENDVKNGYKPKTVNLKQFADDPDMLAAKCATLQADMLLWRTGYRRDPLSFDGTVKALLSIYQRHPDSTFQKLKPATKKTYTGYMRPLEGHIGERRIDAISGVDILRWHKQWSEDGKHLAAAAMCRAIFESAVSFGVMSNLDGCEKLLGMMREARKNLPKPRARTIAATTADIVSVRKKAIAAGRQSSALAYAIVFETTLRLWDVIGQWWPLDEGGISDVIDQDTGEKWFGLRWEDIDQHMMLRYTPSKTEGTTGKSVVYPLSKAPMVIEEIAKVPIEARKGPIIVNELTGLPYRVASFQRFWRHDRKKAGLPSGLWARDLRASGITEGRAANVSTDDTSKVAGHSARISSDVYDRAVLEAADRFADARLKRREQSGNGDGNAR